ncbi:MAG TPA: MMPL family transporter [Candidatus Fimadaptatus faecigallinarum]|uniref:MMPL family transporter n=1 Tax=Candidatus Fimadaptatus faecigallinarum TaxID=2840814 RepID=A0A9D1LRC8_9FIRM|nr:MMPL family transporter [Candidatus Fimadaptatus faecigallinarum]
MERMTAFLLRHKRAVLLITCVLLALSVWGMLKMQINSDISSYLPDNMTSRRTMTVLSEEFGINGDAQCVIEGGPDDYENIAQLADDIAALDDVSAVVWLGTYDGLFEFADDGLASALDIMSDESVNKLVADYMAQYEGKSYYLLTLSLTVPNSGGPAGEVMDEVMALVDEYEARTGADCFVGGNAMQSKNMLDSALGELPQFMLAACLVIAVILLLTSKSLMSSAIFLMTIGISILLNMGTNFINGEISSITFSVAAILQLALSMDYSIFLTHAYERASQQLEPERAMVQAVKRTSSVILASALTTVAGFCALFAMQFELGFDLGLCLAKGVVLSYLSVIIVQPCLMMFFRRACERTQHRTLAPSFNFMVKLPERLRWVALVFCCAVVVPAVLLANGLQYYYLDSNYDASATGAQALAQNLGNQTVFVTRHGSSEQQLELLQQLRAEEESGNVSGITGYYALLDNIASGLSIPIADIEENGGGELMTLQFTTEELISFIEGEIPQSVTDRVQAAITQKAQNLITSDVAARILVESIGGSVDEARRNEITQQVVAEYTAKYIESIGAQMSEYMGALGALTGGTAVDATDGTAAEDATGEATDTTDSTAATDDAASGEAATTADSTAATDDAASGEAAATTDSAAATDAAASDSTADLDLSGLMPDMSGLSEAIKSRFFADMDGEEYTYFIVRINGQPEGEQARATVERILGYIDTALGVSTHYAAGNSQVVTDLSEITRRDFAVVSGLSALLILVILIFTFKSVVLPVVLVALIELAVQINLAIPALQGVSINFMSYVIISAIQLGATIDYAILYTNNFRARLRECEYKLAAGRAAQDSAYSILISMAILASACLSVFLISSDTIIREITALIARGSLISAVLVLLILPALCCLKRPSERWTHGAKSGDAQG